MYKYSSLVITLAFFVLASCGTAETKTDPSKVSVESNPVKTDTTAAAEPEAIKKNISNELSHSSGQSRGPGSTADPAGNEILAHIDQYIVSKPEYKTVAGGGVSNCSVKVTNTLADASIQKAMVELKILKADGSLLRTDYYTVINMEAGGGSKMVLVPDNKLGASLEAHIIKIKSNELTNGEFVLTGTHYVAQE